MDEDFAVEDQSAPSLSVGLPPRISILWGGLAPHTQTPRGRDVLLIVGNKTGERKYTAAATRRV